MAPQDRDRHSRRCAPDELSFQKPLPCPATGSLAAVAVTDSPKGRAGRHGQVPLRPLDDHRKRDPATPAPLQPLRQATAVPQQRQVQTERQRPADRRWLIYKCAACDDTWNRPLLERRPLAGVAPGLLEALRQNDPVLAQRVAFDTAGLRRHCAAVEQTSDATVRKDVISRPAGTLQRLEIRLAVPHATALRLDRLLVGELGLSRSRLHALRAQERLVLVPDRPRALRHATRDGTCVTLDLSSEADAATVAAAACSLRKEAL